MFRSSRLSRQEHHNLSSLTEQQYDPSDEYEHLALQEKDAVQVPQQIGYEIPHEVSAESEGQPIFGLGDRDAESFNAR